MTDLIRVALDVPVDRLFDYRCTEAAAPLGARVLVPFGRQRQIGIIVDKPLSSDVPAAKLRSAISVLDATPVFEGDDLWLLKFAAEYYAHPLGATINAALPAALRKTLQRSKQAQAWTLTPAGKALEPATLSARARHLHTLLQILRDQGHLGQDDVKAGGAGARRALKMMLSQCWIEPTEPLLPAQKITPAPTPGPLLTSDQSAAVDAVNAVLGRYQPLLLRGVTGSGKTEVYLHATAAALKMDLQVLLLVPEIALTPQLESLVSARFPGVTISTLHSAIAESERAERWQAAREGRARLVLGTRLSVFTPMPRLGLIIVDEEHDSSFKQGEGFRYSARDLAVVRAHRAGIPVLLGSATPSLESYRNAIEGRYLLLTLRQRINAALPVISCIDLQQQKSSDGLTPQLLNAIADQIARGEQSMVFINRRGYAPALVCGGCGWICGCERCAARLVVHLEDRELRCHHCGHQRPVPKACPECGNTDLAPVGEGTQRVEAALTRQFPQARILRVDRDSTRRKNAWSDMRNSISARKVDILVGTQILAKGHDFPHLALVGVVNADGLLYSSDFRAAERLYALLTQVAGRAGRGTIEGKVLIQTRFPDHPLYAALRAQDFETFAQAQLLERKQSGFPPYIHQVLLRAEARELGTALNFLEDAARRAPQHDGITIYDPVPAVMMRRAGRERAQLLVQADARTRLRAFTTQWRAQLAQTPSTATRWSLDIDPLDF